MANKREHQIAGAIAGIGTEVIAQVYSWNKGEKLSAAESVKRLLTAALGGLVGGMLPDKLEPAYDYTHRKFFHSYVCGGGVALCTVGTSLVRQDKMNQYVRIFLRSAGSGYLTHLVQDETTVAGLPII